MSDAGGDAIPAATVILFRPREDGPPDLLMLERAGSMAFAPGALVFPGGRVDPGDCDLGRDDDGAARVAAIRETIEEAGIAIGLVPAPDPATITALRAGLAAGERFGALLARHDLAVDDEALVPFARWRPNFREARNFDTRFYLAEVPRDTEVLVDGTECVSALWAGAAAILSGGAHIIFPTRRNLERLAAFATFAEAVVDACRHPVRAVTPWIETRAGAPWLVIPDDLGYPVTAERLDNARRG